MAIEFDKARQTILENAKPVGMEKLPLALGLKRIIAEDLIAPMNVPPFARSPLDGYALKASDTTTATDNNPIKLNLVGSVNCGKATAKKLTKGNCLKIATGAPMPKGADAVIAKEEIKQCNDLISVYQPLNPGDNVVSAGEDIKAEELVIRKGTALKPAHIGMLASMGCAEVAVFSKPQVAIISTGLELASPGSVLSPAKVYDCNAPMLAALITNCQGAPLKAQTVNDNVEHLAEAIRNSAEKATAVITTGGVSVGDEDLIYHALKKIGAKILFWRLKMKPGTPMLTALYKSKLIFCLSGNPGAAHVTFDLFVRPALLSMAGCSQWQRPKLTAYLEHPLNKNNGQNRFIRAKCRYYLADGQYWVEVSERERPGVLSASAESNALIYRKAGSAQIEAGSAILIDLTAMPEVYTGADLPCYSSSEFKKRKHTKRFFPKRCTAEPG